MGTSPGLWMLVRGNRHQIIVFYFISRMAPGDYKVFAFANTWKPQGASRMFVREVLRPTDNETYPTPD
jgi:hypothetical protein